MDVESILRLKQDVPAVVAFLGDVGGDLVEDKAPGIFWVRLRPTATESGFLARIAWSVYPDKAPSVLFASSVGGPTGEANAWPAAGGYRAPNDICKPFTAEGQIVHPEWASGVHAWRPDGNPFLFVVEVLHGDLSRAGWARAA